MDISLRDGETARWGCGSVRYFRNSDIPTTTWAAVENIGYMQTFCFSTAFSSASEATAACLNGTHSAPSC
jgi:hypothetical protein